MDCFATQQIPGSCALALQLACSLAASIAAVEAEGVGRLPRHGHERGQRSVPRLCVGTTGSNMGLLIALNSLANLPNPVDTHMFVTRLQV